MTQDLTIPQIPMEGIRDHNNKYLKIITKNSIFLGFFKKLNRKHATNLLASMLQFTEKIKKEKFEAIFEKMRRKSN